MEGARINYQSVFGNSVESKIAAMLLANKEITKQQILDLNILDCESDDDFLNASLQFPQQLILNHKNSKRQEQSQMRNLKRMRSKLLETIEDYVHALADRWERLDEQTGQLQEFSQDNCYEDMMKLERQVREATRTFQESIPTIQIKIEMSEYLQSLIYKMLILGKIQTNKAKEVSKQIVRSRSAVVLKKVEKVPADIQQFISLAKSFREYVRYGGKDMKCLQTKLQKELNKALTFSPEANLIIFRELISDPLSNIIASCPLLTNAQKRLYYQSQFYKSGILQEYAKVIAYQSSEEGLAQKQRDQLAHTLAEKYSIKINNTLIDRIMNYDLRQILIDNIIRPYKEQIFKDMVQNFKNYYRYSKQRQFLTKEQSKHRYSSTVQLRFALREMFVAINLDFDCWQAVEADILEQKYQTIDDLQLNMEQKLNFRLFLIDQIQPYFYQSKNFLDYRERVKEVVMKTFLSEEALSNRFFFQDIEEIVEAILNNENYFNVKENDNISKNDFKKLSQKMTALPELKQFWINKGEDLGEKRYKQKIDFTKRYLQSSFENKIEVSSPVINEKVSRSMQKGEFIPFDIDNEERKPIFDISASQIMPRQDLFEQQTAADVALLACKAQTDKTESLQIINGIDKDPQSVNQKPEKLQDLFQEMHASYCKAIPDSSLQNFLSNQYADKPDALLGQILTYNPYNPTKPKEQVFLELRKAAKNKLVKQLQSKQAKEILEPLIARFNKIKKP